MGLGLGFGLAGCVHLGEGLKLLVEDVLPCTHRVGPALRLRPRLVSSKE